jgi:thimet oligopeptidase
MLKQTSFLLSLLLPLIISGCQSVPVKNIYGEEKVSEYKPHVKLDSETLRMCRYNIREASELRSRLLRMGDQAPFLDVLGTYNDILVYLDASGSQASLFKEVHPDENIRKDAEVCEQELDKFRTDLSLDKDVYNAIKRGLTAGLAGEDARMLERTLKDFERSGVDKDDATRERIKVLSAELTKLSQEFSENIRKDRFVIKLDSVSDLAGLPADFIASHQPGADGKIEISTDYPDYQPFMQYAENEQHRKALSMKYLNRGEKNGEVLKSILEKRNEYAMLLGYPNYADYQVKNKMMKNGADIVPFINKVSDLAKAGADREYQELLSFKQRKDTTADKIYGYEASFMDHAYKKDKFNFDAQSVRPYFPYKQVRDGLLTVTSDLFDISYKPVTDAKVWHSSVDAYDVYDASGKLGRIYLDMHPRDGKYKHAAQFTLASGLKDRQYPEGVLVCNFPDPKDGDALMEHDQVVTMFHEFGHLLHHVFAGKHKYITFSGVATEWDFVEAPSQMLEEWAWSPEVLVKFAKHYQTQDPIPADLVKKLREAEEFGKAIGVRQQMFYAALSAEYHSQDPKNFDLVATMKDLQAKYSYYPYLDGTHFIYGFGHLDGYGAMYYTYTWSLSRAKDMFEKFRDAGIMNKDVAKSYRDQVLNPGGTADAAVLLENFLGRPFSFGAYEKWLTSDSSTLTMN